MGIVMIVIKEGLKEIYDFMTPFPDELSKGFKQRIIKKIEFVFGSMALGISSLFVLFLFVVDKKFKEGWSELR